MSLHRRTRSRRAVNTLTAIVVSVALLLATTSCTPAAQRFIAVARASKTATVSHPRVRSSHAIANELFAKINAERRNRGMRQLRTSRLLTRYAAHWGRHLIATRQFRHQNLGHIIVASHYRLAEVGENLFRGSGRGAIDAGTAHTSLMRSPSHRANILLPQAQVVGIAALCTRGHLMVVEEFGIKAGAPLPKQGQGVMPLRPLIAKNLGGSHC